MPSQLKILFVDDHEGLRDGVSFVLSRNNPHLLFVNASNSHQAVEALKSDGEISNAIVDINLDGENGIDLIALLRQINPKLNVLVYTMYCDVLHIEAALRSKVQGYITKDAGINEVLKAVSAVSQGGVYYTKRALLLMHSVSGNDTALDDDNTAYSKSLIEGYKTLTKKEQQVFMLLAEGNSTGQIASTLKKAEKTVINQRSMIYSKLNIKDRLDLQNAARMLGVIV